MPKAVTLYLGEPSWCYGGSWQLKTSEEDGVRIPSPRLQYVRRWGAFPSSIPRPVLVLVAS